MFSTLAELQALFNFTDDDLNHNRQGKLSARQLQHIRQERFQARLSSATALLSLPSIPACILSYFLIVVPNGDALGAWVLLAIVVWFCGLLPLGTTLVFFALQRMLKLFIKTPHHWFLRRISPPEPQLEDILSAGTVERLEGILRRKSDGEHHFLLLGDEELANSALSDEDDERLTLIQTGRPYALYRVPEYEWVLAVEPLETADNADPQDRL